MKNFKLNLTPQLIIVLLITVTLILLLLSVLFPKSSSNVSNLQLFPGSTTNTADNGHAVLTNLGNNTYTYGNDTINVYSDGTAVYSYYDSPPSSSDLTYINGQLNLKNIQVVNQSYLNQGGTRSEEGSQ